MGWESSAAAPSNTTLPKRAISSVISSAVKVQSPDDTPSQPLQGWVVMLTGFDTEESEALCMLSQKCGAAFRDALPRHPPHGGLAVLAKQVTSTVKFLSALAWGVPPVTEHWLHETARSGVVASAEPYALALRDRDVLGC